MKYVQFYTVPNVILAQENKVMPLNKTIRHFDKRVMVNFPKLYL